MTISGRHERQVGIWEGGHPLAILLGLGCLNGLVARLASAWHEATVAPALAALSAVTATELLVIAIAARFVWTARLEQSPLAGITIFALLLLIPSSLASWLAIGALGLCIAWRSDGGARRGGILFALLALGEIWFSVGDPLFGQPLRAFDASLAAGILSFVNNGVIATDNLIVSGPQYSVVVLTGCSTAAGLPWILLGWTALLLHFGVRRRAAAVISLVALIAGFALLNLVRLTAMGWSFAAYDAVHGPVGANLFDAAGLILMIVCALAATSGRRGFAS